MSLPDLPHHWRRPKATRPLLPNPVVVEPDGKPGVSLYARTRDGGLVTLLVSPKDYRLFAGCKLYIAGNGYPCHTVWDKGARTPVRIFLHRAITRAPVGQQVDHANRNPLDCRRSNLRYASESQNTANRSRPRRSHPYSSQYRGVTRHQNRWQAGITCQRIFHFLGMFDDEAEAAVVYNEAASRYFGEFAVLNQIDELRKAS